MEIPDVSESDYYDIEETFAVDEFEDPRSHERSVEKQINRIFKGTVVCADEKPRETTNHEVSGSVSAERKVDERYGEVEHEGTMKAKYRYNTNDNKADATIDAELDTRGNYKVEAGAAYRW